MGAIGAWTETTAGGWPLGAGGGEGGGHGPAVTAGWWALGVLAGTPALLAVRMFPLHAALAATAALALTAAALIVLNRPAWGACALILIVYWNASDVITDAWGFSWLLRLALAGVLMAAVADALASGRRGMGRWPVLIPLLAYGAAQAAASLGAIDPSAAQAALLEYGKALIVFYLVANLLRTPRALRRGVNAVLAAVALLSLPVIYQGLTGSQNQFWGFGSMLYKEIVPGTFGWRLGGAMGDPNFLAMVLVASLPLALMQALERGASPWRRAGALAAAGLALVATLYTYSRASLIGVGLVVVVLAVKHRRRRWVLGGGVAVLLVAVALMPRAFFSRLGTLGAIADVRHEILPDTSFQVRRNALYAGALMFARHPLLGVGPGNFPENYLQYSALVGLASDPTLRDAHDLYIQIAAETGLAGLATFLWLMWASFGAMEQGRRRLRRLGADNFGDLIWALELALATYLTLSLFLHGAYFRHFLLLLALGTLAGALAQETPAGKFAAAAAANPPSIQPARR